MENITLYEAMEYIDNYLTEASKLDRRSIPTDIAKDSKIVVKVIEEYSKDIKKSDEYKAIISDLIKSKSISLKDVHKKDEVDHEVKLINGSPVWFIRIYNDMSDKIFNHKVNGTAIFDLTYDAFKKIKSDKRITALSTKPSIVNGDDYYGWEVSFKLPKE